MKASIFKSRFLMAAVLTAAAAGGLSLLAGCGSSSGTTGTAGVTATTPTATTAMTATPTGTTAVDSGSPAAGPSVPAQPAGGSAQGAAGQASPSQAGPYTTMAAAESYVKAQPDGTPYPLAPQNDDTTIWRQNAVLHVIHARIPGGSGDSGDYYYFFVNGNVVGKQIFTNGSPDLMGGTDSSFFVRFEVYKHGDPGCCPTGGESDVEFVWNGTQLLTQGSLQGALEN